MKKIIASLLALCMMLGVFTGCSAKKPEEVVAAETAAPKQAEPAVVEAESKPADSEPKYVFLFIGDGMSYLRSSPHLIIWALWRMRITSWPSPVWMTTRVLLSTA